MNPGIAVTRRSGGNLIIESPYQNAANARVVVERADVVDLLAALKEIYCWHCGDAREGRTCHCENDE